MTPNDLDAIRARAEAAAEHVGRLATKEDRWRMSVPVREDDSDVLLMEVADTDIPTLLAEVGRLRAELAESEREHEKTLAIMEAALAERDRLAAALDRVRELVDEANEWRPVESRDEGECFPAVIVDDLIAGLRAAIEGTDS